MEVHEIEPLHIFEMAGITRDGEQTQLVCTRTACIDTELPIKHGSWLLIRIIPWIVAEQYVSEPLFGTRLQETLGLNTHKLLAATADCFSSFADAEDVLSSIVYQGDGGVSRVMEEAFHAGGGESTDNTEHNDGE